jgi:hypothetical protein
MRPADPTTVHARKFVLWWDGQAKQHGGVSDRKRHLPELGKNGLPERLIVHRWRTRLKDEKHFQKALDAAQLRCIRVCEASKGATDQRGPRRRLSHLEKTHPVKARSEPQARLTGRTGPETEEGT